MYISLNRSSLNHSGKPKRPCMPSPPLSTYGAHIFSRFCGGIESENTSSSSIDGKSGVAIISVLLFMLTRFLIDDLVELWRDKQLLGRTSLTVVAVVAVVDVDVVVGSGDRANCGGNDADGGDVSLLTGEFSNWLLVTGLSLLSLFLGTRDELLVVVVCSWLSCCWLSVSYADDTVNYIERTIHTYIHSASAWV